MAPSFKSLTEHHQVSQNASTTAPAKLLAVFVVDMSDRQIVIPDE